MSRSVTHVDCILVPVSSISPSPLHWHSHHAEKPILLCIIRLLQASIACMEQDQPTSVERPLDLDCSGISNPHLCIEAIPHPSQWDDVWLGRIRALAPKDLTILHKQFMQRCNHALHQVRRLHAALPQGGMGVHQVRLHAALAWGSTR